MLDIFDENSPHEIWWVYQRRSWGLWWLTSDISFWLA